MPSDMQAQLDNTVPKLNYSTIDNVESPLTLANLDSLNDMGDTDVYLTSNEGINATVEPEWFKGVVPNGDGETEDAVSSAIIVNDHGDGTVDAFYFYFYAYVDEVSPTLGPPGRFSLTAVDSIGAM